MSIYHKIRECIERCLSDRKEQNFILYPFGEQGMLVKSILNEIYGIKEALIIDNQLAAYNSQFKELSFLEKVNSEDYLCLLTSSNPEIYDELREGIKKYMPEEKIIDIFPMEKCVKLCTPKTKFGKYSYGPLCNHWLVESVGSFSSFAPGTDVLENHATDYISTAPFIYRGKECNSIFAESYIFSDNFPFYFEGVQPKGQSKNKRIVIRNDVWLGKNVLITNGADIGNGVIAGAGAVITKDVPDYAIVGGVPARIIRYRYTQEQIRELNVIAWWDWPDEKIREYYDDFFEVIVVFIAKHRI